MQNQLHGNQETRKIRKKSKFFSDRGSVNLGLVVGAGVALMMVTTVAWNFPTASNQGFAPEQPIPFSHRLHAGQYKLQCLYCHAAAERSVHATIPSLNVCMNCHSVVKTDSPYIKKIRAAFASGQPIEWVRVHELPDYVHFSHKRHVQKGVACETCHGPVKEYDRMYQYSALTMGWCMECHRGQTTPSSVLKTVYPEMKNPHGQVASTNCSTCHY